MAVCETLGEVTDCRRNLEVCVGPGSVQGMAGSTCLVLVVSEVWNRGLEA